MKKILAILGHTSDQGFSGKFFSDYVSGAREAGNEVREVKLGEIDFDPILWKGYREIQELEPDLQKAQEDILWADHILIVFPNWWGSFPAILKGFFDRIILPGFGYKFSSPRSLFWKKLLKGRTARIIIAMDSPVWYYSWFLGRPGEKVVRKCLLEFCGISPVRTTKIGPLKRMDEKDILRKREKIKQLGRRGK